MRIVVYTSIFGDKDELKDPDEYRVNPNIDYVCITNNPELHSDVYKIKLRKETFTDITKNARYYKINGFIGIQEYSAAIWHDSSLVVNHKSIEELALLSERYLISTFKHPQRNCIYHEAIACIVFNKDYPLRVTVQIMRLFSKYYPIQNGLFETSILVINPKKYFSSGLNRIWWHEVKIGSRRDQLSFNYALWKSKLKPGIIHGARNINPYSRYLAHIKSGYEDKSIYRFFNSDRIKYYCIKLILIIIRAASKRYRDGGI